MEPVVQPDDEDRHLANVDAELLDIPDPEFPGSLESVADTEDLSVIDFAAPDSLTESVQVESSAVAESSVEISSEPGARPVTYSDALAILKPYLKRPWELIGNIGRSKLFGKMLAGNADYEYFRLYSNKDNHFSPIRGRIFDEVTDIAGWVSHPEQRDFSVTYFGSPICIVRDRNDSGAMETGIIGRSGAFALSALRFYQAEYEDSPAVSKALQDVEGLIEMAPNINYESCAWWLIATMVMRESDEAELVKALEECHGMILVAADLAPVELKGELTFMEIQPAKERTLVEKEELIPSFDFRVHAKQVFDQHRGRYYGTAVGFFEIKRTGKFSEASDLTSVIKSTITKKLEKPYQNQDGSEDVLLNHPSLKALIIQVAWPEPGESIVRERKKGYRIFDADGLVRYGFVRNGVDNEIRRTTIYDEIATNLNRIPGSKGLDAIYLTDLQGELIQTFYHSATVEETGVFLSKEQRDDSSDWVPHGDKTISMKSYFSF